KPVRFFGQKECGLRSEPLLALASTHSAAESKAQGFGRSPGRRCGPKPVRFLGREECGVRSEPCWRWLLRIQPRNQGQQFPAPALAVSTDQDPSASWWPPDLA